MDSRIKSEIETLRSEIRKHEHLYYVLSQPKISDFEYDRLYKQLEKFESENPELITPDSPTQRVGSDLTKEFPTVVHQVPMLSLANTYSKEELLDFDRRVREMLHSDDDVEYVTELKIDGVSVSAVYENGILKTAATRGDGTAGEDITNNIRTIKTLPLKVSAAAGLNNFEVRGEIFMASAAFAKLNEEREKRGEKTFANPRNSTAGAIKLHDPKQVSERPLDVFLYFLRESERSLATHYESLEKLRQLGFKVNPHARLCSEISEVLNYCEEWESKRDDLQYEIDGIVVKVNSYSQQDELGYIAKSPRWAVAFKFKARQQKTKIEDIRWQVGRTGALTPVADLSPVFLAGSTISHATLHNFSEIQRKDIRKDDTVIIEKGGDVIPKVVEVVLTERSGSSIPTKMPESCPVCGEPLYAPEDEVAIYCDNAECNAQIKGKLEHFASRGAMDIEGLGKARIDQFGDLCYLKSIADICDLTKLRGELIEIEGFG